jgi:hypothetical protein
MTGSCSSRKTRLDKNKLIPEKELISLLTDIHLTNGLLNLPGINEWASQLDSISIYYQVIEKHGYTKEMMDKTMKYYFLKRPKRLNKIYDQVLGRLSEMESRVEIEAKIQQERASNLWRGKDFYSIPSTSGNDSTSFDVTLYKRGYYTFTFTVILFPDDESLSSGATVTTSSSDSTDTGNKQDIRSIYYIKDGRPHTYNLTIPVLETYLRHLKGSFYDFDNNPYNLDKHIFIENISITFNAGAK